MIKENKHIMKLGYNWEYSFKFWNENLNDMITKYTFIDLGNRARKPQEKNKEFFFSMELKNKKHYGYLEFNKDFQTLFNNYLFMDRYDNTHISFIEWDNNKIVMIIHDGLYISNCYINLFDKDNLLKFFGVVI